MASTYVEIVNDAIAESGADLSQYSSDGSDFTTQTDPLMGRFKVWVDRAWREIQRRAFDWQFLSNQGTVTVQPGIMFYVDGEIPPAIASPLTIYGSNDIALTPTIPITGVTDITYSTYSETQGKSLGYFDIDTDAGDVTTSYKAGGDYFNILNYTVTVGFGEATQQFFEQGAQVGDSCYVVLRDIAANTYTAVEGEIGSLISFTPAVGAAGDGQDGFVFTSNNQELLDLIATGSYQYALYLTQPVVTGINFPDNWFGISGSGALSAPSTYEVTEQAKAYLHSWKSFDFSEEIAADDYQGEIRKINAATFRIVDHESPSPSTVKELPYCPWDVFDNGFNDLRAAPSFPQYITQDNTGRWRMYPHPYQPVTLKFDFDRIPQKLETWSDVPKGLPEDFTELIMWLAVRYYGEWEEQPGIARRAERYFKDMLQRLEIIYRPKFRFKPARLW